MGLIEEIERGLVITGEGLRHIESGNEATVFAGNTETRFNRVSVGVNSFIQVDGMPNELTIRP
jgi:hypothetical protein